VPLKRTTLQHRLLYGKTYFMQIVSSKKILFTSENRAQYEKYAIIFLIVTHSAGFFGMRYHWLDGLYFKCTPFNLILSFSIVLLFCQKMSIKTGIFLLLCGIIGYFSEVVGANTGILFGNYVYGDRLGIKCFGVPVLLGWMWAQMIYCAAMATEKIAGFAPIFMKAMIGALLLVGFDALLEPNAVRLQYWSWENGVIPIYNYVCWFGVSFLLMLMYYWMHPLSERNTVAIWLLMIQSIFFCSMWCM
jgi:bisanhydrobacterioruberin hydratase